MRWHDAGREVRGGGFLLSPVETPAHPDCSSSGKLPLDFMSPLLELVKKVNDLMKGDLLYGRDLWLIWLYRSVKLVAVGLVFEAPELIYEIRFIILRRIDKWKFQITFPERHIPDFVKILAFLGWILIVGGVVGEWVTEVKVNEVDVTLQEVYDTELTDATIEAGDAKTNAQGAAAASSQAKRQMEEVEKQTDALKLRLGGASRQLGKLEQELLLQGPRSRLLKNGESAFVNSLKRFSGQHSTVVICGQDDTERFGFEQLLINMLREAQWAPPDYQRWDGCL
jgi:hypothetical protein